MLLPKTPGAMSLTKASSLEHQWQDNASLQGKLLVQ